MKKIPTVSVIVPFRNPDRRLLRRLLEALRRQTRSPEEIIMVDDGSRGNPGNEAQSFGAKLVRLGKGRSAAAARNEGIRYARGDILVFTDADCEPAADWVDTIASALADERAEVAAGGVLIETNTRFSVWAARLGFPAGGNLGFEKVWPVDSRGYTTTFAFCNCAIRRRVFERHGPLDEDIPGAGGEDTVFAARLVAGGVRIRYTRAALVVHAPCKGMGAFTRKHLDRGRGNYWIKRKVQRVAPFLGLRLWSTSNLLRTYWREPDLAVTLLLLFWAAFCQTVGFLAETIRMQRASR